MSVPYKVNRTPATTPVVELFTNPELGGNCELLAQAIINARGFALPPLRSSQVFEDRDFTVPVDIQDVQTGDIVGFRAENRTDYFGLHVGIVLVSPDGLLIVHNARHQQRALVQTLSDVTSHEAHGTIAWIKRPVITDPGLGNPEWLEQVGLEELKIA